MKKRKILKIFKILQRKKINKRKKEIEKSS